MEAMAVSMDIRGGMCRLSLAVGLLGVAVGGYFGYPEIRDAWHGYAAQRDFAMASAKPTVQRVVKAVREYKGEQWAVADYANGAIVPSKLLPSTPLGFVPESRVVSVNTDGIEKIELDFDEGVSSIYFADRGSAESPNLIVFRTAPQSFPLMALLYPILGFLMPYGAIMTLTWIVEGFLRTRG